MTDQELDDIADMVLPFNGPLVLPILKLIAHHRHLKSLHSDALKVIQAYGEEEGYIPSSVQAEAQRLSLRNIT